MSRARSVNGDDTAQNLHLSVGLMSRTPPYRLLMLSILSAAVSCLDVANTASAGGYCIISATCASPLPLGGCNTAKIDLSSACTPHNNNNNRIILSYRGGSSMEFVGFWPQVIQSRLVYSSH